MNSQIQSLKDSELTQVLADGFAMLFHNKPDLPVTYLAQYMKNYLSCKQEVEQMGNKISHNIAISKKMAEEDKQSKVQLEKKEQEAQGKEKEEKEFLQQLEKAEYHEDKLDSFCEWISSKYCCTGTYIGELLPATKPVNLDEDDSEEAHLVSEAPKIIKFNHACKSHRDVIVKQTLGVESVMGRLITGALEGEGEGEGGEEGEGQKEVKPKGQIYIPSVVGNKDLHFFRYPKLGAFFALSFKIKSYLSEKVLDANIVKTQTYEKALEDFEREMEERETKFREAYDEKAGEGADEQELQEMEKNFEIESAQLPKPQLEDFEFVERSFVLGVDTLGQDREIRKEEQDKVKELVNYLKEKWEGTELKYIKQDIQRHLKLEDKIEGSHQEAFSKLAEEEDKELPSSEEVEKFKENQKLMELEVDTLRIEKIKEYLSDERYEPFLEEILHSKVLKFKEVLKYWFYFNGIAKQNINIIGTNLIDLRKAKKYLNKDCFVEKINSYNPRGGKPETTSKGYFKWDRILRSVQEIDLQLVAASNFYLAIILRYLKLVGKIRMADRERRIEVMKEERKLRKERIKENEKKSKEKEEKMEAARAECEEKEEQFDQEAWEAQYNEAEENQMIQVGPEIVDEIDRDLENGEQMFPQEEEPVEVVEEKAE